MQGGMYDFEGKKFFCFGKAESHDKEIREEGIDWWPEEMPSDDEYEYGINTLKANNNKCDFVISHCAPNKIVDKVGYGYYHHNKLTTFLQEVVANTVDFEHWYFGHYHLDEDVDVNDSKKYTCCYQIIHKVV